MINFIKDKGIILFQNNNNDVDNERFLLISPSNKTLYEVNVNQIISICKYGKITLNDYYMRNNSKTALFNIFGTKNQVVGYFIIEPSRIDTITNIINTTNKLTSNIYVPAYRIVIKEKQSDTNYYIHRSVFKRIDSFKQLLTSM